MGLFIRRRQERKATGNTTRNQSLSQETGFGCRYKKPKLDETMLFSIKYKGEFWPGAKGSSARWVLVAVVTEELLFDDTGSLGPCMTCQPLMQCVGVRKVGGDVKESLF